MRQKLRFRMNHQLRPKPAARSRGRRGHGASLSLAFGLLLVLAGGLGLRLPHRADIRSNETPQMVRLPLLLRLYRMPVSDVAIVSVQPGQADEYVTLENRGQRSQDVTGWKIQSYRGSDCGPADQWYTFPNFYVLASGASVRVHSGPEAEENPPTDLFWTFSRMWNDQGDVGVLYNARDEEISRYCYGRCCE